MGEDVLQADQPHQDLLVGFLGQRVPNDMKLYDAAALLQPGRLITSSVWRQQISLENTGELMFMTTYVRVHHHMGAHETAGGKEPP